MTSNHIRLTHSKSFNQGRKSRMDAEMFANHLIMEYSVVNYDDRPRGRYELDIDNVPQDERREFASLILASDDSLASEATGPDNGLFQKQMLPSLLSYMKNPTDLDSMSRLAEDWADGTSNYLKTRMQELIDCELEIVNETTKDD